MSEDNRKRNGGKMERDDKRGEGRPSIGGQTAATADVLAMMPECKEHLEKMREIREKSRKSTQVIGRTRPAY